MINTTKPSIPETNSRISPTNESRIDAVNDPEIMNSIPVAKLRPAFPVKRRDLMCAIPQMI
jgi:hypothetical protein